MIYNLAAIRELVSAAFNDEELATFCADHFRPVYENRAAGQSKGQRVLALVDFAERQGQLEALLSKIAKVNPYQFGLFADRVRSGASARTSESTSSQMGGGEQTSPRIGNIDLRGSQGAVISPTGPVTQTFGPMINTGGGAYVGGNVNTGGGDFVGRDHIGNTTRGATPQEFAVLLIELRAALAQAKLDAEEREIAEGDLEVIETQAGKPKPKLSVIDGKLNSIKALIEGAAGVGMAATGLVQVVQRGIELAQQLFR